jgi:predicted RNA-binding protein YlqC (UPF0109 family)
MSEDSYGYGADSDSSDDYDDEDSDDLEAFADEEEDEDDEDEVEEDEDDGAEVAAEGNRIVGALPKGVLEYLARNIVEDPDGVFVEVSEGRGGSEVELRLHVSPADMGKVIGRRGRVAQELRQVVAAAGNREGVRASLDIVD